MKVTTAVIAATVLGLAGIATAQSADQQSAMADSPNTMTVRGCLNHSRGNYVVAEDKTGMTYVLRGVGNKLDKQVSHEVEVTGSLEAGSQKTGVRSQKDGSNPADTVHGVDGTPLFVSDVKAGIKTVGKCKAGDSQ
jgi:hypothetical protein